MFRTPQDLPKATNGAERQKLVELASQQNSAYNNPCIKEEKLSYKCLDENNYDKKACSVVFANLKACRSFWVKVQRDRRKNGLKPDLPWPEDREEAKLEYMKKFNMQGKT